MGLLDNLFGRKETMNITVNYVNNVLSTIQGMDPADLYETQDALRAVVDFISESIAGCPLKVYIREDDNDRKRDTTSDWALLLKEPNDHQTTFDFINSLCHELELYKDALIMRVQDADSKSGWTMEVIPQTWILSTKTDGFKITKYQILNPYSHKEAEWYDAKDFLRIHGYETGKPGSALSPVAPLKDILKEQISAWTFRNQVWERGGRTTAYITRPADAGEWSPEQRDRFVKAWKERYSGNKAPDAGGMPLFEDGMEIKSTQFNAHEAEWAEALKLSRESVAGVYHINPGMIWSGSGQSYASAKENARSLYVDCLGPRLEMISQAFTRFLLPALGAPENAYVEFDIKVKLSGSFEEQSDVMVRATGTAYQTINETRALMNLPRIDDPDADQIVKPLNVIFGGQASPLTPTGDGGDAEKAALSGQNASLNPDSVKEAPGAQETADKDPEELKTVQIKGSPKVDEVQEISATFRRFYKRQSKSVLSQIDRARDKGTLTQTKADDDTPQRDWFDMNRWNNELRDDLASTLMRISSKSIRGVLEDLGQDTSIFDDDTIRDYITGYAEHLAVKANTTTLKELIDAVENADSFENPDALKATPQGVFEYAEGKRSDDAGRSVATGIKGFSSREAIKAAKLEKKAMKTWVVTSSNPRPSHARLNGETVPFLTDGEETTFSNGMRQPGDWSYDASEVAGCCCELDLDVGV